MTFAVIQASPLRVIQTYQTGTPPEPVIWPDGAATHGATAGFTHGPWILVPVVYVLDAPNEFYTLDSVSPSFDGTTLTYTQKWIPFPLDAVQATLVKRLNQAAEQQRQQYITAGPGQAMVYLQKLSEALDLAKDPNPLPANYPLLNATVGVEAGSLADVAALVTKTASQWIPIAGKIENIRLSVKAAIMNAQTVDDAVAAWSQVTWV